MTRRAVALLLAGCPLAVVAASPRVARAAPCPSGPATVHVSGTSASSALPVVQAITNALGGAIQVVYQEPGACAGLAYVLGSYGAAAAPDPDPAFAIVAGGPSSPPSCTFDVDGGGEVVDVGVSDVYPTTCMDVNPGLNIQGLQSLMGTVAADYLGPVEAVTFAVPAQSAQAAISANAAYMVFGFGASAGYAVTPWTDPSDIYVRSYDTGTTLILSRAINVPVALWVNASNPSAPQTLPSTGAMGAALADALGAQQQTAIGALSAQSIGSGVKALAFQASGQSCGYLPDAAAAASDRINVRQGRYAIWGPSHYVANVGVDGQPVGLNGNTAAVQAFVNALLSTAEAPPLASTDGGTAALTDVQIGTLIDSIASAGLVPTCAMQVERTSELGPEASYEPPAPCGCRFTAAAAGAAPSCTACTTADGGSACTGSTPVCRFGYCESQ
jgi:hypothetical protein